MKQLLSTAIIGLWATGVLAHSPLEATTPANEETVAVAPTEIILDFKGKIRLTRVSMTHANKHTMDLDLGSFEGFYQNKEFKDGKTGSSYGGSYSYKRPGYNFGGRIERNDNDFRYLGRTNLAYQNLDQVFFGLRIFKDYGTISGSYLKYDEFENLTLNYQVPIDRMNFRISGIHNITSDDTTILAKAIIYLNQ